MEIILRYACWGPHRLPGTPTADRPTHLAPLSTPKSFRTLLGGQYLNRPPHLNSTVPARILECHTPLHTSCGWDAIPCARQRCPWCCSQLARGGNHGIDLCLATHDCSIPLPHTVAIPHGVGHRES